MSKVTVKAPRSLVWLALLLVVGASAAAIGPLWLSLAFGAAFFVVFMGALFSHADTAIP